MARRRVFRGTFTVADGSGRRFEVRTTQDVDEVETLDGAVHRVDGLIYLHIGSDPVNDNGDGTYTNVRTQAVLRRV